MSNNSHYFIILLFLSVVTSMASCVKLEEDIDSILEIEHKKVEGQFVIAQWNIGHFSFGNTPNSAVDAKSYNKQFNLYKGIIDGIDADIFAICEYSKVFGSDDSGEHNSREVLFNNYDYAYEGHQAGYSCNALFSNIKLENIATNAFTGLNTGYYYLSADWNVKGRQVKIISTHLAFNMDNDDFGVTQIQELIEKYQNCDYVIMLGDWNIKNTNVFDLFTEAGYQLANHGSFGDFETFSKLKSPNARNYAIDNIVVRGLSIKDVKVLHKDLSDHYPIIATISLDNPK